MAKIQDLDALLDFGDEPELPSVTVHILGQDFKLNASVNTFHAMALVDKGDANAVYGYFESMVHEDDWMRFRDAIGRVKNLDGIKLLRIINVMTEALTERPTEQPSASSRGRTKKTSSPRSAASTPSKRAATSAR